MVGRAKLYSGICSSLVLLKKAYEDSPLLVRGLVLGAKLPLEREAQSMLGD